MQKIPNKLKQEILTDTFYKKCCLENEKCDGRITWEHTLIYAGKQINEKWAIIPLCEYHHSVGIHQDGDGLNKEKNIWVALNRATDEELINVSKANNYLFERNRLNNKYGKYSKKR